MSATGKAAFAGGMAETVTGLHGGSNGDAVAAGEVDVEDGPTGVVVAVAILHVDDDRAAIAESNNTVAHGRDPGIGGGAAQFFFRRGKVDGGPGRAIAPAAMWAAGEVPGFAAGEGKLQGGLGKVGGDAGFGGVGEGVAEEVVVGGVNAIRADILEPTVVGGTCVTAHEALHASGAVVDVRGVGDAGVVVDVECEQVAFGTAVKSPVQLVGGVVELAIKAGQEGIGITEGGWFDGNGGTGNPVGAMLDEGEQNARVDTVALRHQFHNFGTSHHVFFDGLLIIQQRPAVRREEVAHPEAIGRRPKNQFAVGNNLETGAKGGGLIGDL